MRQFWHNPHYISAPAGVFRLPADKRISGYDDRSDSRCNDCACTGRFGLPVSIRHDRHSAKRSVAHGDAAWSPRVCRKAANNSVSPLLLADSGTPTMPRHVLPQNLATFSAILARKGRSRKQLSSPPRHPFWQYLREFHHGNRYPQRCGSRFDR